MSAPAVPEIDAQYRQLREECGLLDRSDRGKFRVRGGDAAEYLQGQLTNEIEGLRPGEGCYAALLDRKGHMQADMRVVRLSPEEFWIDTEGSAAAATLRHLETYKIGRAVEVVDETRERALLSLVGPRSEEIADAPGGAPDSCREVNLNGVSCLAIGAAVGVDLCCEASAAASLRSWLLERGAAEVGEEAAEILRIEAGLPRLGADMGAETMPAEAGIVGRAVSFSKGCYIGQETVARLHYRGRPNRHLRGLRLESATPAGASLTLGDREVGTLTSSCVSPALGPIGLGILRREAEPGSTVRLEGGGSAEVVELPFAAPL